MYWLARATAVVAWHLSRIHICSNVQGAIFTLSKHGYTTVKTLPYVMRICTLSFDCSKVAIGSRLDCLEAAAASMSNAPLPILARLLVGIFSFATFIAPSPSSLDENALCNTNEPRARWQEPLISYLYISMAFLMFFLTFFFFLAGEVQKSSYKTQE
jgi:hypothetical protein